MSKVEMVLPVVIGGYTDFFSSIYHKKNCGIIFRGPQTPIRDTWFQLPVAYHGRASSIIVSGADVVRLRGQSAPTDSPPVQFGPSEKLDFELEMYSNLGKDDVCSKEHIELANEAARQGIVLLKKDDNALPLTKATCKTVVAIGPHAKATNVMLGNYAGVPCQMTFPIVGLEKYAKVEYQMGCSEILCRNRTFIFDAMEALKNADATIIYVGIDLSIEAESRDRVDLDLPGYQNELIQMVSDAAKGPVVIVVLSAGGVDLSLAKNHPNVKAILWAGYPGEKGGQAIADILFGKYNPGGRLPHTWYPNDYVSKLPMTSMPLRPVNGYPGRTYKLSDGVKNNFSLRIKKKELKGKDGGSQSNYF
ncbi:hypothetical protein K2173_013879 [Erythroxylum novogranatense]|uniref:Glycoside hydrolase family 3 C-terminal domain-containing protein n=1 Tax=Erythroxylum novogranatense TaxID=1862640 RepID=A0AAV8SCW3_9ROSI|nr:hypothetical protein K2173_013879 [Erythroxylum novogranatense]